MTGVGNCVHRCTHVLDLEKTLAFYETALGITETRRKEPEDGSWIIVFASNEKSPFELEFTWNKGVTEPYNNGGKDTHIAFRVPDMEEARKLHDEMGCVVHDNPAMGLYFIEDPDGCWIEILPENES